MKLPRADAGTLRHAVSLVLMLAALWLALSGHTEPLILGLGAVSVALVAWLAHRMDVVDHEGHPVHLGARAPVYWAWLGWEICKANWDVARRVLRPGKTISPTLVRVPSSQKTDLGRVLFANSITLTPGTVTLHVEPGFVDVHALTREAAADLLDGEMDRRVTEVEDAP